MTTAEIDGADHRTTIRLWPGVAAVALQWLVWLAIPYFIPGSVVVSMIGGLAGGLVVALWWIFFSRAPWLERVGAILLMAAALAATMPILHQSIRTGMMGMLFFFYAIPALSLALVAGAVAGRGLSTGHRRALMASSIVLGCGAFGLLRTGGIDGDAASDFRWRWTKTSEEQLLAKPAEEPAAPGPAQTAPKPVAAVVDPPKKEVLAGDAPLKAAAGWPGFRGPVRDGVVRDVRVETDWEKSPPVALWRRPVGPGWSSFAVDGDLVYTQEQRGDDEAVSCYSLRTGKLVWMHRDAARFWESNAGAGPRATPAISNGRVYSFGATGILNALDARDGSVVWSRNAASDTGTEVPGWGFASSPLVTRDAVIVAAAGTLAAYDATTGKSLWTGQAGVSGYSSPHLVTIGGVPQVLLLSAAGAIGVAPADGTLLWKHTWRGDGIVQPAMIGGDVLIGAGSGIGGGAGIGIRRIGVVQRAGEGWTTEERWTSAGLKPYYNDFVVHKGHAFGFDGSILSCIDLGDGKRKWKGGRYGHGQLVLLARQDLLLVLSEEGEIALVRAAPDRFTELTRFKAIEGKTWNHPVLAGDVLLARNSEEMAAFRLPLMGR